MRCFNFKNSLDATKKQPTKKLRRPLKRLLVLSKFMKGSCPGFYSGPKPGFELYPSEPNMKYKESLQKLRFHNVTTYT